jgi:hypothetical protein
MAADAVSPQQESRRAIPAESSNCSSYVHGMKNNNVSL